MGFLRRLFGIERSEARTTKQAIAEDPNPGSDAESDNSEVRQLVSAALAVIDQRVQVTSAGVAVDGAGSEGPLMKAARDLECAVSLSPSSPWLHYAYCSALAIAAQGATARSEMERLKSRHPDFRQATWALARWESWRSLFALPPWDPQIADVHARIQGAVISCTILPTREGMLPRATLFLRDADGNFQDFSALARARIDITTVIDRAPPHPVVGIYARIWDDPKNSLNLETHLVPSDVESRISCECLVAQHDIDLVVLDCRGRILLNRRLPLPKRMQAAHRELTSLLDSIPPRAIPSAELLAAMRDHQSRFRAEDLTY